MNITIHNYEEFFLLYTDNELSAVNRRIVEQFVQENPHLEEEFDMICNSVISPEQNVYLPDKSFLLKTTGTEWINKFNYEEKFVLFHDGELTELQKVQAKQFLDLNPDLKNEFLLIGQAKIQDNSIIFPEKKSLLRREHSGITGRIIMFRSLAAAVVLGFGLWIAIPYFTGDSIQPQIVQNQSMPDRDKNSLKSNVKIIGESEKTEKAPVQKKIPAIEQLAEATQRESTNIKERSPKLFQESEKQILAQNQTDKLTNFQSIEAIEGIIEIEEGKNNSMLAAQIPQKMISTGDINQPGELYHVDVDITSQAIENNSRTPKVVYLDVNKESSGNYIFYNVPTDQFRKTKIGVFLKKLKRVAERNDPIKRLFEMEADEVASVN